MPTAAGDVPWSSRTGGEGARGGSRAEVPGWGARPPRRLRWAPGPAGKGASLQRGLITHGPATVWAPTSSRRPEIADAAGPSFPTVRLSPRPEDVLPSRPHAPPDQAPFSLAQAPVLAVPWSAPPFPSQMTVPSL